MAVFKDVSNAAAFLVVLALLDFVLKVMQEREEAGMGPQPKPAI
jgi:hypothetical protein